MVWDGACRALVVVSHESNTLESMHNTNVNILHLIRWKKSVGAPPHFEALWGAWSPGPPNLAKITPMNTHVINFEW